MTKSYVFKNMFLLKFLTGIGIIILLSLIVFCCVGYNKHKMAQCVSIASRQLGYYLSQVVGQEQSDVAYIATVTYIREDYVKKYGENPRLEDVQEGTKIYNQYCGANLIETEKCKKLVRDCLKYFPDKSQAQ